MWRRLGGSPGHLEHRREQFEQGTVAGIVAIRKFDRPSGRGIAIDPAAAQFGAGRNAVGRYHRLRSTARTMCGVRCLATVRHRECRTTVIGAIGCQLATDRLPHRLDGGVGRIGNGKGSGRVGHRCNDACYGSRGDARKPRRPIGMEVLHIDIPLQRTASRLPDQRNSTTWRTATIYRRKPRWKSSTLAMITSCSMTACGCSRGVPGRRANDP